MRFLSFSNILFIACCFLLFPLSTVKAQSQKDMDNLMVESERLLYINPEKSILIDSYIFKESTLTSTKVQSLLLQSQAFLIKQEYNSALSKLQQAHNLQIADNNLESYTNLLFYTGLLYQELQLSQQAESLIGSIENYISDSKKSDLEILLMLFKAQNAHISKENQLGFLNQAKGVSISDAKVGKTYLDKKSEYALAQYFLNDKQLDSATFHLKIVSDLSKSSPQKDYYQILANNKLGEIAFLQKNTELAKELLELNINETKFGQNIFLDNYKLLSRIYYDEGNLEKFSLYQKLYVETSASQAADLQEARVHAVNFYVTIQDHILDTKRTSFQFILILLCCTLITVLGLLFLYYFKAIRKTKNQFLVLKNKNELEKAINDIEERVAKENVATTYAIPEKTEQAILEKLSAFEASLLFTDASLSMQSLASKLNTNTKYLSDIINNKKNKNFKTYINELRIEYIAEKLKTNPDYLNYKTSYLAKEAGFTSRSSFAVIFKNVMGVSPSTFIDKCRDEKK